jgi:DNA-binding NtrC family response regulator
MEDQNCEGNARQQYVGDCDQPQIKGELANNSILLVDDEKDICVCLGHILRSTGHPVITCTNSINAVEFYKKHYMSISLVILDVVMPVMNGGDVFLAMKAINPAIKAVMISGQCCEDVVTKCMNEGALEFVRKPFSASEIIGVVDRHILTSQPHLH